MWCTARGARAKTASTFIGAETVQRAAWCTEAPDRGSLHLYIRSLFPRSEISICVDAVYRFARGQVPLRDDVHRFHPERQHLLREPSSTQVADMMRAVGTSLLPVMGGAAWMMSPLKPAPKAVVPPKSAQSWWHACYIVLLLCDGLGCRFHGPSSLRNPANYLTMCAECTCCAGLLTA